MKKIAYPYSNFAYDTNITRPKNPATKQCFLMFKKYKLSTIKHLLKCTQTFDKRLKSRSEILSCFYKIK
jgi:hypothetical protein